MQYISLGVGPQSTLETFVLFGLDTSPVSRTVSEYISLGIGPLATLYNWTLFGLVEEPPAVHSSSVLSGGAPHLVTRTIPAIPLVTADVNPHIARVSHDVELGRRV